MTEQSSRTILEAQRLAETWPVEMVAEFIQTHGYLERAVDEVMSDLLAEACNAGHDELIVNCILGVKACEKVREEVTKQLIREMAPDGPESVTDEERGKLEAFAVDMQGRSWRGAVDRFAAGLRRWRAGK